MDNVKMVGVATQAVDIFNKLYENAVITCGISHSGVQDNGMRLSSVKITCARTHKSVVVVLDENHPNQFAIAIADKGDTEGENHKVLPLSEMHTQTIVESLVEAFGS